VKEEAPLGDGLERPTVFFALFLLPLADGASGGLIVPWSIYAGPLNRISQTFFSPKKKGRSLRGHRDSSVDEIQRQKDFKRDFLSVSFFF